MGTEAQEQKPAARTERGQLRTRKQALASALQEKAQTGQAMQPENRQGEKAQTGQGQPSNATAERPGENALATGNVHISSANGSRMAEALMSTGRSQNINVAVNVGTPLPGEVDLLPLSPAVASLVPEFSRLRIRGRE
jgi:hypothetical protein